MMGMPQERIEPNYASLIGGIVVGIAVVGLWFAIARELDMLSPIVMAAGVVLAVATASWIRLANL